MGRNNVVTLDSSASKGEASDTLNFSVNVNNENSFLLLGIGNIGGVEMNATNSTIRLNGVDMNHLVSMNQSSNSFTSIWYYKNPPTGSVSISGGFVSPFEKVGIALVYTGATLATPLFNSTGSDSATTLSLPITVSIGESRLVGFWTSTSAKSPSSGTTEITELSFGGVPVDVSAAESTSILSNGSQSIEQTHSGGQWSGAVCVLAPGFIMSGQPAYTGGAGFMY